MSFDSPISTQTSSLKNILDRWSSQQRDLAKDLDNPLSDLDPQSQTDPTFQSTRLYTRITAEEVRRQLILTKGYKDDELPTSETIRRRLNELGYSLKRVAKT